jgi:putative transferase (TIGR04331 family)
LSNTKRRLFLSRVEVDFDPSTDIAAGPWCFADCENDFNGWDDLPFIDSFSDWQSLSDADVLSRRLANHMALSWSDRMNTATDRSYSADFWRRFLILWIVAAIETSWRCYTNLQLLVERYGSETLHVRVLENTPTWSIDSVSDMMDLLALDSHFDFWMKSLFLRNLAPDTWTIEQVPLETSVSSGIKKQSVDPSSEMRRSPFRAAIGRLGFDHVQGTKLVRPFYSLLINLLPRLPASGKKFSPDPDVLKSFPLDYLSLLDEFLEATFPSSYGEGLPAILKKAEALKYKPGRLTITHAASVDTENHLINALAVESGERVVGFQHGGWYGISLVEPWSTETEYIYHAFISWGWTEQADFYGNVVPLPAPILSEIRNKHKAKNDHLIFVGTRMFVQNDRFDNRPSSVRWLTYRKIKRDFINALKPAPRATLQYRPYHRAKPPLQDGAYISKHFPDIPILEDSLHDAFLKCRLLVLDHPGTTLSFAMAANVPTVCYWNPQDWPLCKQAKVQFDSLKNAGLLFDNPEDAASHINEIWDDIPGWWKSSVVQNALLDWRNHHARTSGIWWWHWAVAVWQLATGRKPKQPQSSSGVGPVLTKEISQVETVKVLEN